MRWTLPVLALTLSASAAGSAAAASPAPRTLAVAPGPIAAFAQDGSRIAWFRWTHGRRCNGAVSLRAAAGGRTTRLPALRPRPATCAWSVERFPVELTLAGTRPVWLLRAAGNTTEQYVFTASAADRRERALGSFLHETDGAGDWVTDLAGDAPRSAFAVVRTGREGDECDRGGDCAVRVVGGSVSFAGGARIPFPAARLAFDGQLLATARATAVGRGGEPYAAKDAPIAIRTGEGEIVASVRSPGRVHALAFASPYVVAFVGIEGNRMLFRWDSANGSQALVPVPPSASQLSVEGGVAIYRVGRAIHAVDLATGGRRLVARATGTPVGLSLEGDRLAWAENVGGRGRIRALTLP